MPNVYHYRLLTLGNWSGKQFGFGWIGIVAIIMALPKNSHIASAKT